MLIISGKLISSVKLLTSVITTARLAVIALNSAFLTNPFGMAVVGVAALGGALTGLIKKYQSLQKEHQKYTLMTAEQAELNAFISSVETLQKKVMELGNTLTEKTAVINHKTLTHLRIEARKPAFFISFCKNKWE